MMALYQLTVTTLSPLHIGTGDELRYGFDFEIDGNRTYRLNVDKLLEARGERLQRLPNGTYPLPASLLESDDFRTHPEFFRYDLADVPRLKQADARLRECIKDVFDCPYIPGSSLKGAFRTALMGWGINQGEDYLNVGELESKPKSAASAWEKKIFGKDPNYDLLRVLHISDSKPVAQDKKSLVCLNVSVVKGGKHDSPIVVEAIEKRVTLELELSIDELTLQYIDQLEWQKKDIWLVQLWDAIKEFSLRRIKQELNLATQGGYQSRADFYQKLLNTATKVHERGGVVLQIGWGTGWLGTTIVPMLPREKQQIILRNKDYTLGKSPKMRKENWTYNPKAIFPKTRRLVQETEWALGWVAISYELIKKGNIWKSISAKAKIQQAPSDTKKEVHKIDLVPKAEPKPIQLAPAEQQVIIREFTDIPKPGDIFYGTVFADEGESIYLEIPGLDPDTNAYALLSRSQNPLIGKVKEGYEFKCKVVRVKLETKDYYCVICQIIK